MQVLAQSQHTKQLTKSSYKVWNILLWRCRPELKVNQTKTMSLQTMHLQELSHLLISLILQYMKVKLSDTIGLYYVTYRKVFWGVYVRVHPNVSSGGVLSSWTEIDSATQPQPLFSPPPHLSQLASFHC